MPSRTRSWSLAVLPALAALSCGPPSTPQNGTGTADASPGNAAGPAGTASEPAPPQGAAAGSANPAPGFTCGLPAPVKSQDTCQTDADCGVSQPCHARECVAKARANPPAKDTICTQIMDCASVDANPCVCFEGVCALVPPKDAPGPDTPPPAK